jgi:hypothetical protein
LLKPGQVGFSYIAFSVLDGLFDCPLACSPGYLTLLCMPRLETPATPRSAASSRSCRRTRRRKNGPSFFEGHNLPWFSLVRRVFASAILSRYLGKLWVVGKLLGLGFMGQRFLSILFEDVIDKWLTRFS